MSSSVEQAASPSSKTFRRAFIKRRNISDGLFESEWFEITEDVKKWGNISISTTPERPGTFRFSTVKLKVANDDGSYNPNNSPSSLWFGFMDQQRTLVKIEFGFIEQTKSKGVWTNISHPQNSFWDIDQWDKDLSWDSRDAAFIGILSGDPTLNDSNEIQLTIRPLTQLFKDYPANRLDGYTTTGMTASQFVESIRDHTTGSGNFVFRPFFGDTTTNWDIQSTTINYLELSTSTSVDIVEKSVWSIVEKLGQSELFVPFIDFNGVFRFKSKDPTDTASSFFFGKGFFEPDFGNTIKKVERFGPRIEAYYSRVQVKFNNADTNTSFVETAAELTITSDNGPWTFGYRTFRLDNFFIPTSTVADSIASSLFNDLSSLKDEIKFRSSFIPHVRLLDKVEISYDSTQPNQASNWNENDWNTELTWDDSKGDAINLQNAPFKILKVHINLDNFETLFIAREI